MRIALFLSGLALIPTLVACSQSIEGRGAALYRQNCASCHGPTGAGDGPLVADLPVPPANLRLLSADNDGIYPEERVIATIHGYQGKNAEALMPEFGALIDGPKGVWTSPQGQQIPTPQALLDLSAYLQTLQDP
ncbi:MAG: c-type cytochrome [Rhodobacteraceae bacterium]|nr:c-type cytochrome [Paracoccaceae bacterium]